MLFIEGAQFFARTEFGRKCTFLGQIILSFLRETYACDRDYWDKTTRLL
jgi:hypothetical protein